MKLSESTLVTIIIIVLINILNVIDMVTTMFLFERGLIAEVNPIMDYFLQLGYGSFIAYKLIIVAFCSWLLYYARNKTVAKFGFSLVFVIYFAIAARSLFYIFYINAIM